MLIAVMASWIAATGVCAPGLGGKIFAPLGYRSKEWGLREFDSS